MKVIHVVGARPNFMKMAPLKREMDKYPSDFEQYVIHSGQHYDENMSKVFFLTFELPEPDYNLGVGSGSHSWQIGNVMIAFEKIIEDIKPDVVLVYGDVNATLACALVSVKLGIKIAHIEAGLRSGDRTMPEEINRILTDQISDLLLIPSIEAKDNLLKEGIGQEKIHFVGNIMIDSLVRYLPQAKENSNKLLNELGIGDYALITLHRPSNVDDLDNLRSIIYELLELSKNKTLVFPVHPRTKNKIEQAGLMDICIQGNIKLINPAGYIDFLSLQLNASYILTDSGGIQEESTYLQVPCFTFRENTERPVTISHGSNFLIGALPKNLSKKVLSTLDTLNRDGFSIPEKWDGSTSQRIVDILLSME